MDKGKITQVVKILQFQPKNQTNILRTKSSTFLMHYLVNSKIYPTFANIFIKQEVINPFYVFVFLHQIYLTSCNEVKHIYNMFRANVSNDVLLPLFFFQLPNNGLEYYNLEDNLYYESTEQLVTYDKILSRWKENIILLPYNN